MSESLLNAEVLNALGEPHITYFIFPVTDHYLYARQFLNENKLRMF